LEKTDINKSSYPNREDPPIRGFPAFGMLPWFVKEQVEEEEHARDILNQITITGNFPAYLFCLDHQLGKRG
jgi:ferritin